MFTYSTVSPMHIYLDSLGEELDNHYQAYFHEDAYSGWRKVWHPLDFHKWYTWDQYSDPQEPTIPPICPKTGLDTPISLTAQTPPIIALSSPIRRTHSSTTSAPSTPLRGLQLHSPPSMGKAPLQQSGTSPFKKFKGQGLGNQTSLPTTNANALLAWGIWHQRGLTRQLTAAASPSRTGTGPQHPAAPPGGQETSRATALQLLRSPSPHVPQSSPVT